MTGGILAEEAEHHDAGQGGTKAMGVCKDLQVQLESHQVSSTGGMWAMEKVVIGFIGPAL